MFTRATLKFLSDIKKNNNREWFQANKDRYESDVREPAFAYIESMAPRLAKISDQFVASPKKVGGSLMRIHRDVRFGKDKTPYKVNVGIQFRHVSGKDVHAPGYYLHIESAEVFLAAGIWKPDSETLNNMRMHMHENPARWKKIKTSLLKKGFELHGDSLKRPPRGYDADHPLLEDLKRKDFIAVQSLAKTSVTDKDFAKKSAAMYKSASGLVEFICEAGDLEF